jgi:hypothetical protein
MMSTHRGFQAIIGLRLALLTLSLWLSVGSAHQAPYHRLHSCPSDHGSYVYGAKGRCDQCPYN